MKITKTKIGNELTVALEGRLDTTTAPELEKFLESELHGLQKLVFEFKDLEYISSAGLRVLIYALQCLEFQNCMTIRNCSPEVLEVFEVTGFMEMVNIQ